MTTYALAPLKAVAMRATLLDSCGVYDPGSCAMFATPNLVSIEQTAQVSDQVEFPLINANGDLQEMDVDPERLKWLDLNIMVTKAIPELVNWMTGDALMYNDAASPSAIGWKTQTNSSALSNFALEIWTRLSGAASCSGTAVYGYVLWPWLKNGSFREIKHENGLSDLSIKAQTHTGSPWSTGPYSVGLSEAVATLGEPIPLVTAVGSEDHRLFQRTTLGPPASTTDCTSVVGALAVVDDDGVGAGLDATATLPTPTTVTTPGFIDWGEGAGNVAVAAGSAVATHTYALAGTYTVEYRPSAYSDVVYTGDVTMT